MRLTCRVRSRASVNSSRCRCRRSSSSTLGTCTTLHTPRSPAWWRSRRRTSAVASSRSDLARRARRFSLMLAVSTTGLAIPRAVSARCSQKPSRRFVATHHRRVGGEPETGVRGRDLGVELGEVTRRHRPQTRRVRDARGEGELPDPVAEIQGDVQRRHRLGRAGRCGRHVSSWCERPKELLQWRPVRVAANHAHSF